jgi:tetratricopeptide (TPR) repeat protein
MPSFDSPPQRSSGWGRAAVVMALLAAAGGGAVLFQEQLFGAENRVHSSAAAGGLQHAAIVAGAASTPSDAAPTPVSPHPSITSSAAHESNGSNAPGAKAQRASGFGRGPVHGRESALAADSELGKAEALVKEGTALSRQRRFGLAEGLYLKALQISPNHPGAMAELVRVHVARRDGAEALRWAERLVAAQPTNLAHQLLLGDAYELRGDSAAARAAWTKAARGGNAAAKKRIAAE